MNAAGLIVAIIGAAAQNTATTGQEGTSRATNYTGGIPATPRAPESVQDDLGASGEGDETREAR